jgi:predicted ArsR family transcriptional regulator
VKINGAAARVARRLLEGGPSTATHLAEDLGLTPAAVRRHLDALEAAQYLTVHEEAPFGPVTTQRRGRGRPAKVCALTAAGRDAFEQSYDDVAMDALRFMASQADENLILNFARSRSRALTDRYAALLVDAPVQDRVRQLALLLSQDGYAANVQDAPGGSVQLCEHHCPMAHVAEEFPEFCEAEQAAFSQLLGVHTVRISTIASGSNICTTHVPGPMATTAPGGAA